VSTSPKISVVGASGYSGLELLRILLQHPAVDLASVTSRSEAGRTVAQVFPRFRHIANADTLTFTPPDPAAIAASGAQIALLALPHGVAAPYAADLLDLGLRVIDLSADFRLRSPALYEDFYGPGHPAPQLLAQALYGLPEWRATEIAQAQLVAAPGCYPTSILLPLLPLLRDRLVDPTSLCVASMSGVSGAGRSPSLPLLYCEANGSVRPYGAPRHRHLAEIEQELALAAGQPLTIRFVPHLVPITQGIATTIFAQPTPGTEPKHIASSLHAAYHDAPLVRLLPDGELPDTKNVAATAFIDIAHAHDPRTGGLLLFSAEDNLGKGAAAQAVQCLNLMLGLPTSQGLLRV